MLDNKRTISNFWLLVEHRTGSDLDNVARMSMRSHTLSVAQNFPAVFLVNGASELLPLQPSLSLLKSEIPCDVHLLNFRSLPSSKDFNMPSHSSLMMFHRLGYTCSVFNPEFAKECFPKEREFKVLFDGLSVSYIEKTSLTGTKSAERLPTKENRLNVDAMEIQSYNVTFATKRHWRRRS